jgi:hypothetical protein
MSEQASKFVQHHPSVGGTIADSHSPAAGGVPPLQRHGRSTGGSGHQYHPHHHHQAGDAATPVSPAHRAHRHRHRQHEPLSPHQQRHASSKPRSRSVAPSRRPNKSGDSNGLQVRRTLRVKVRKSRPILGIAIEGGFNVSGQLIPRIVCVHVSSRPAVRPPVVITVVRCGHCCCCCCWCWCCRFAHSSRP